MENEPPKKWKQPKKKEDDLKKKGKKDNLKTK